jgi:hypothetical protein
MALFGSRKKPNIFELSGGEHFMSPMQMGNHQPLSAMEPQMQAQAMPQQQSMQPPMPGSGKMKPNLLGLLGDTMTILGGGQATYVPSMYQQQHQQRQDALRAQMAEQQRMQGREDMQWEWQNKPKEAPNNDTINDVNWYANASQAERDIYHKMNPIVQTMADGSQRLYDPNQQAQPMYEPAPEGLTFGKPILPTGGQPVAPVGNFPIR